MNSDLVKRLRRRHERDGSLERVNPDGPEAADYIEALEAAASVQPSREADVTAKAVAEIQARADKAMAGEKYLPIISQREALEAAAELEQERNDQAEQERTDISHF